MRSKIAKRILSQTPEETRILIRKHSEIIVRIYQILKEKDFVSKDLSRGFKKQ